MDGYGIFYLVVGSIVILLGVSGLSNKTRKGQRLVGLIGETGARAVNIIVGILLVLAAFFL